MTAPRRRLRNRILTAMVAVAIGVLVFTGLATIGLTRRAAVDVTRSELEERAPGVAEGLRDLQDRADARAARQTTPRGDRRIARDLALLVRAALRVSNGTLVGLTPDGTITSGLTLYGAGASNTTDTGSPPPPPLLDLPADLSAGNLDVDALDAGDTQTGTDGDTVFVAMPLAPTADGTIPVLVLANRVEQGLAGRAGPFFLFTAVVAAIVAAIVSYLLARRFTRPIATMNATAGRIAAGDLSARADLGPRPTDELGELATTLNRMAEQLERARGQERAFLLSVSHDLRTPLTSIRGYAEAMTDGTADDPATRTRAAAVIASESRRLERLVADLLQLARLDAHEFSLHPRTLDAVATVRDALDAFRPAAEAAGLTLHFDAPPRVSAEADPERLGQIVANLVENALKYATTRIDVDVAVTTGNELEVRVRDDGPGIEPDDLTQVFERLYTARGNPARAVGTGLGLAIVRELAVAMRGTAAASGDPASDADGDVRGGATFVVTLPVLGPGAATR